MNSTAQSDMNDQPDNASRKRDAIIEAAYKTFSAYGFRRTSMGDIAEAVGISRPALYLQFENKPDIFRALVKKVLETSVTDTCAALAADTPLPDRLLAALEAGFIQFHRDIGDTSHGEELFSAKTELAADLGASWSSDLQKLIADALGAEGQQSKASPEDTAAIIIDAMMGMKQRNLSINEMEKQTRALVTLVAGAPSQ